MMGLFKQKFAVNTLRGDGVRGTKGVFDTKSEAQKFVKKLNSRVDADTRDPKIIKFKGFM